jgi:hypothetical protein
MNRFAVVPLAAACLLSACGRADEEPPAPEQAAAAAAEEDTASVFAPQRERQVLPSGRIYFTLTDHAWYARGEPLLHESRPYNPAGMPVPASLEEMEAVGDYQGVEYYIRSGATEPALYVPVFEGYWQAFRADTTARPVE